MDLVKSASAIATSIGSATAWAVIDGILGTLAALLAIVAGLLGLWWGDVAEDALLKAIAVAPLPGVEGHAVDSVRVVLLDDDRHAPGAGVPGLISDREFFDGR